MDKPSDFVLTTVLATLGPASATIETVQRMVEEGARVFRINFSHGDQDSHRELLDLAREAARLTGHTVGVLGDLPGPKIRLAGVPAGMMLSPGDRIQIYGSDVEARVLEKDDPFRTVRLGTNYPALVDDVGEGQRLFIDDGAIRMLVTEVEGVGSDRHIVAHVTVGGPISSAKGLNLPDTDLSVPALTDRDWAFVDWALDQGLDYLALSFVRHAADVRLLNEYLLKRSGGPLSKMPVIAKIEKPQALDDLAGIARAADAIMVARGDLGVEVELTDLPVMQKEIIATAHDHGKPVIVATQMLQSMIDRPSPTRAEVTDVANAIFDGADAVMLSGETAVGKYPVQTVRMMARIAASTQQHLAGPLARHWDKPTILDEGPYRTAALARGIMAMAEDLDARFVICWSQHGGTARYLSKARLLAPIIAANDDDQSLQRMALLFGVVPVKMPQPETTEAFVDAMDQLLLDNEWAMPGDPVLYVLGEPIGTPGVTNNVRIHYVRDAWPVSR